MEANTILLLQWVYPDRPDPTEQPDYQEIALEVSQVYAGVWDGLTSSEQEELVDCAWLYASLSALDNRLRREWRAAWPVSRWDADLDEMVPEFTGSEYDRLLAIANRWLTEGEALIEQVWGIETYSEGFEAPNDIWVGRARVLERHRQDGNWLNLLREEGTPRYYTAQ